MRYKEENGKLIPPPVNYRTPTGWIMNFNLNPSAMDQYGFPEWTEEQYQAWKAEHPDPAPPERTIYSKLSIRRAMRELNIESKLDNLLNSSAQFRADWNDAREIDLADPVLLAALESGSITTEEIAQIKQIAGGSHE